MHEAPQIVVHCYPLLSIVVHCYPSVHIVVIHCGYHRLPLDGAVIGTFLILLQTTGMDGMGWVSL